MLSDSNLARQRPTIGLALRGASSRSLFYIGFLEVLNEQKIPIDYIAAMSGSAVVAAAYACGTLPELKETALNLNREFIGTLFERSQTKTGMYSLNKGEEIIRQYTRNMYFEDVRPLMGFVAVDINKGEEVVLSMGDIARAVRATCSLPGIFEPVEWGNRALVDGGIMSVIPGNVAQQAGMDIVIGIDLRNTDYVFSPLQIMGREIIRALRKLLFLNQAERLGNWLESYLADNEIFSYYSSVGKESEVSPGMFSVLGRSMDLALAAEKENRGEVTYNCDLLIKPVIPKARWWRRFFQLDLIDFSYNQEFYMLGRKTAKDYIPKIWQMMADFEQKQKQNQQALDLITRENSIQKKA